MLKKSFKKIVIALVILSSSITLLIYLINNNENKTELEIIFFDVGQGDSIFINTPNNQQILIDGGPDTSVVSKIGEQLNFFDHDLDLVVLTHPHADHIMGLIEVLKRYEVKNVLYYDLDIGYDYYLEWERIVEEKHIQVLNPIEYSRLSFGEVEFAVIYPFQKIENNIEDINDSSIVLQMEFQGSSFLLTGDATKETEEEIIKSEVDLKSDVLKVGHHGSKYSTSFEFLDKVQPKYAVIQSGEDNKFGHPHNLTVNKLKGLGLEILRNDEIGDIKMTLISGMIEFR